MAESRKIMLHHTRNDSKKHKTEIIMKSRTIPLLLILLVSAFACKKEPDLTLVEETVFEGSAIRSIAIDADWDVELVCSETPRVELSYSKCLEKGISADLNNGKLSLWLDYSTPFPSGATMKAVVYTNEINSLTMDYSSIVFKGTFSTSKLSVQLKNNSSCSQLCADIVTDCEITLDKTSVFSDCNVVCAKAMVTATNSSRVTGTIAPTDSLNVELNNNSRFVNYQAETHVVKAKLVSSSLMNIIQSPTQNLDIELVASEASVNVNGNITGSLTESSTLYYKGVADLSGLDVSSDSETIQL